MPRRRWLDGDHQAKVGDVVTGAVRVAGDREAADDDAGILSDVDGGVWMAAERTEVAPLLADGAPAVRVQQPRLRLPPDRGAELDQGGRIFGPRLANENGHPTTMPWPPRRGSPAAARVPSGRRSTAETPPK